MKDTISNQNITADFNTFGGELISLRCSDLEYLWQGDKTYWGGQAPVLFPIVGCLRNKQAVTASRRICRMERHGVARKREFVLKDKSEDSITFALRSDLETKERFPYDFELEIQYFLLGKSLTTRYTVCNPGNSDLPFQIGGHPGFRCPLTAGELFEDYIVEFEYPETADCPSPDSQTGLVDLCRRRAILKNESVLKLNHHLFENDALIFDSLRSDAVKLFCPKTGRGIQMEFHDFKYFLIWSSSNGGPFVALEPWSGLPTCADEGDSFEKKRGMTLLPPGQSKSFHYTIEIIGS
ncbi:Protein LacX, plasmid [Caprobacter fermentans]|uniref:Aldose 1-epimerase family protein n=1 Tax=Caproicibacter fermentans TaxID=2576756 RepID=A0A6N8I4V4_9FIRM|nr:aldose 1-epimerase family protein [Caproicibacter fermentans]MVB12995.1 Protein LacX, plasmid [Caproicibacter fermentans]OCN02471.1 protein lacX [Clostridium sp. W14A]QNK41263.1 aldose 1-epimerase family protein [Caproicibacter fermentans]